ncbi:MAG: RIP metalloprotease RseP [Chloroflexota bacterium]
MSELLMGNSPVSAIIAFFVVLIPLILIHELGHFIAAKMAGITVLEFGIGFPPRIVKLFTWGGTEFTLNWIPLGGFVRPLGEDMIRPLDEKLVEKDREELIERQNQELNNNDPELANESDKPQTSTIRKPKAVNEARPLARIGFMAAGALANFVLAFVLFAIIALTGIPQPIGGSVYIVDVKQNSLLASAGLQNSDIILDIDGQNFTDSQSFWAKLHDFNGKEVTLTVQRGETPKNIRLAFVPHFSDPEPATQSYAQINGIVPDAPADKAGIKPGDIVIAFNSSPIAGIDNFRQLTQQNAGQEITITLLRSGSTLDVKLTPRVNPPEGQGAIGIVITPIVQDGSTGTLYQEGFVQQILSQQPFDKAVQYGVERVVSVITMTVRIPSQLVSGAITPEEARPVSVVGMSQIGAQVIRSSIEQGRAAPILDFIAVISVALGFFNLLPIPALDGGRIVFVLLEIVRGRPISPEREGIVHLVGLALLLSLSVLIILNDVVNPITNVLR